MDFQVSDRRKLFIFDFDHTLVDDNTDRLPFEKLEPDLLRTLVHNRELYEKIGWTELINKGLGILASRNHTPTDITAAAAEAPFHAATIEVLQKIHEDPNTVAAIASDANTLYIEACLNSKNLSKDFFEAGIFTNSACVEDGRVKISPFASGHECKRCPANMCKGEILKKLMSDKYKGWTVVYTGDGGNDFCPVTHIPKDGFVLARAGYTLEKRIDEFGDLVQAKVFKWKDASEMANILLELLR